MPSQHEIDALSALVDSAVVDSVEDVVRRPDLHVLADQLARATAFLDSQHSDLGFRPDSQQFAIDIAQLGQAIAAGDQASHMEARADATDMLEQALTSLTHDLGEAKIRLGQQLDAHHESLEHVQRESAKTISDAATHLHAVVERLKDEISSPVLAKAHDEAGRIVHELIEASATLMRDLLRGLTDHVSSAESALVRTEAVLAQSLHDLEMAARHRLDAALNDVANEFASAITARVVAIVQQELAEAIQALAVGEALTTALASTGPWLAVIHAAKEALDLLG